MCSFKLLQSFMSVADAGTFHGAAKKLNRSQSAVCTQVMQLEKQIGLHLFERMTRRTKLTPDGEKLWGHMLRAPNEIETSLHKLRQAASDEFGEIAMACLPRIAGSVLPPVPREFISIRRRIKLRLVE